MNNALTDDLAPAGSFACSACGVVKPPEQYAKRTRQCKPCRVAKQVARQRTPEGKRGMRSRKLKMYYGITADDYDQMLAEQGGKCKICGSTESRNRSESFSVDHDHATGKVRGLLCLRCNSALGWYESQAVAVSMYLSADTH